MVKSHEFFPGEKHSKERKLIWQITERKKQTPSLLLAGSPNLRRLFKHLSLPFCSVKRGAGIIFFVKKKKGREGEKATFSFSSLDALADG